MPWRQGFTDVPVMYVKSHPRALSRQGDKSIIQPQDTDEEVESVVGAGV